MTKHLIATVCAASLLFLLGCTHVVGFHPVKLPEEMPAAVDADVDFYMSPELKAASYSFRAVGSGIAKQMGGRFQGSGAPVRTALERFSAAAHLRKRVSRGLLPTRR